MIKQLGSANQTEIFKSTHVNNNRNSCGGGGSGNNQNDSKINHIVDTPAKMLTIKKQKEMAFNYFIANKVKTNFNLSI